MTNARKNISGTLDAASLRRLTWPVAWSGGTVDEHLEAERDLVDLATEGLELLATTDGATAVVIRAGEITSVEIKEAQAPRWVVTIAEDGGSEVFEAADEAQAWERAIAWARTADWPAEGCVVSILLRRQEDDFDDAVERRITIPADEESDEVDPLASEHRRTGHEHAWVDAGGPYGRGGMHLVHHERCDCGARRISHHDPLRHPSRGPTRWVEIEYS